MTVFIVAMSHLVLAYTFKSPGDTVSGKFESSIELYAFLGG